LHLCNFYFKIDIRTAAHAGNTGGNTMNSKIVCAALSLAIALSGASVAMAGGKKEQLDPRAAYISSSAKTERPNGRQNNCDTNPECNGWAQALRLANAGKLKY
jgi:hypothetical protein